jgi:hypothetical protein
MKWVVSVTPRPRFSPGERTPVTHCTGGSVGPRAGLDTEARGKILSPLPGIEPRSPGRPARIQTLYWLSYPAHADFLTYTYLFNFVASVPKYVRLCLRSEDEHTTDYKRFWRKWSWPIFKHHHCIRPVRLRNKQTRTQLLFRLPFLLKIIAMQVRPADMQRHVVCWKYIVSCAFIWNLSLCIIPVSRSAEYVEATNWLCGYIRTTDPI